MRVTTKQRMEILRKMKPTPDEYTELHFDSESQCQSFKSRLSKFNNSEGFMQGKYIHGHFPKGSTAYLVCVTSESAQKGKSTDGHKNAWLENLKKN